MRNNQRERLLIFGALACVVLLGGDRFVVTPLIETWKAHSARIVQLEDSINAGNLLSERQDAIRNRWTAMRERSLPADPAVTENQVLSAVGNWAMSSRITVTALKPRWLIDEEAGDRYEVRVSANGDLATLARFLYEMERDPLALKIEDAEIRARDDKGIELTMETRFTGLILPEEAQP